VKELNYKGNIIVAGRGIGYFSVPEFEEDVEIQGHLLNTALNGDEVEIKILPKQGELRQQGEVLNVIKRAKNTFVGTLIQNSNGEDQKKDFFFLKPDDRRMYRDIFVHSSNAEKAKNGDKVQVEITGWKDPLKSPEGKVVRVLGRKGVHNVEMEAIILERGFEDSFPKEVEKDAERIAEKKKSDWENEITKRKDMRDTLTFTIDPADAKDFDDALSFKKLDNKKYEIGIHIADVSHFVEPGTILDKEAVKRGTSVYLVDRTIPMLPEILSNDLCSLNPNVPRFTFSAIFTIDENAKITDRWFGKTIIHSDRRFSYEDAQAVLDQNKALGLEN
jgi:VacB/RNase II family 3'-5' exoribonuclease